MSRECSMGYGWVAWIWAGGMVLGVKVYIRGLVRVEDRSGVNSGLKDVLMRNMETNFDVCHFMDIGRSSTLALRHNDD